MESSKNNGRRLRWSFGIATVIVAAVYISKDLAELPGTSWLPDKSVVGFRGFVGLVTINIVLFTIPMLKAMGQAREIEKDSDSQEEAERALEEVMAPALQGETEAPAWLNLLIELPVGVSAGLIAGVILAWGCTKLWGLIAGIM